MRKEDTYLGTVISRLGFFLVPTIVGTQPKPSSSCVIPIIRQLGLANVLAPTLG